MDYPTIEFEVWGDYALFTDPITGVGGEKFSYQVPTYEALKGMLKQLYWKPTFIWVIDEVRVMNQIRMEEIGTKPLLYNDSSKNELAYYTYLSDVRYQVRAHMEWNYNRSEYENDRLFCKHIPITYGRFKRGERRPVVLGTTECKAFIRMTKFGSGESYYDNVPALSFGNMYFGRVYPDEAFNDDTRGMVTDVFFRPVMRNGIIKFPCVQDCTDFRKVHPMKMKRFKLKGEVPA